MKVKRYLRSPGLEGLEGFVKVKKKRKKLDNRTKQMMSGKITWSRKNF